MALYRYVKQKESSQAESSSRFRRHSTGFPLTSALLMISGIFMVGWVMWPIVAFELIISPTYKSVIRPIPDEIIAQALDNQFGRILGSASVDYTKASNWFPKSPPIKDEGQDSGSYTVTIPKLGITNARAIIGGDDLDKGLIHYGGTALPGEYGNSVIFGHSVLPAFFDPTNYLTIFSTLPTLTEKDEIFLTYDDVRYKYVVYEMKVVSPDDISVLEQKFDWSYISLVTCVPPGTYWKRLIVRAKLETL